MAFKLKEHTSLLSALLTMLLIGVVGLFFGMDRLKALVASAGMFAPLAFILLKASTVIIAPLSGGPVYPLVGALFGYWPGILYTLVGDYLGYTGAFYLARTFGRRSVEKLIAGNERGLLAKIVDHVGTVKGLIHACFTSFAMPELICYASGLSKMPYWKFMLVLMPLGAVASSTLVFAGALLGDNSLLVSVLLPIIGTVIIFAGGLLFVKGVREK